MFLNIRIDWIILKTYDQQFTLTTKKSLHIIFKEDRKKFWSLPRYCTSREHNAWKRKVKQQLVKHRLTVENDCYAVCVCMHLLRLCHILNSCLLLMTSSVQRGLVVNVVGSKVGRADVVLGRH